MSLKKRDPKPGQASERNVVGKSIRDDRLLAHSLPLARSTFRKTPDASAVVRLASLYPKSVRWSEEDACFVGTVHQLAGDCCHGDDAIQVFREADAIAVDLVRTALRENLSIEEPSATIDMQPELSATTIREALGMPQAQFARFLGISVKTLHKWEQHTSRPSGAARSLLKIAAAHPSVVQIGLAGGL